MTPELCFKSGVLWFVREMCCELLTNVLWFVHRMCCGFLWKCIVVCSQNMLWILMEMCCGLLKKFIVVCWRSLLWILEEMCCWSFEMCCGLLQKCVVQCILEIWCGLLTKCVVGSLKCDVDCWRSVLRIVGKLSKVENKRNCLVKHCDLPYLRTRPCRTSPVAGVPAFEAKRMWNAVIGVKMFEGFAHSVCLSPVTILHVAATGSCHCCWQTLCRLLCCCK